jgi:hypothetical protein
MSEEQRIKRLRLVEIAIRDSVLFMISESPFNLVISVELGYSNGFFVQNTLKQRKIQVSLKSESK